MWGRHSVAGSHKPEWDDSVTVNDLPQAGGSSREPTFALASLRALRGMPAATARKLREVCCISTEKKPSQGCAPWPCHRSQGCCVITS